MHKGQRVYFGRPNGEKTLGEVVTINAKSIKVKQLEARGGHPVGTPWRVAPSMVTPADGSVEPAAAPVVVEAPKNKRPELDIMRDIGRVHSSLSPENLSCDGERSRSEVARWRAHYNRQLKALFAELGRHVDESEAYDYLNKNAPPMGYMQGRGAS